jgi:hypothetical protein
MKHTHTHSDDLQEKKRECAREWRVYIKTAARQPLLRDEEKEKSPSKSYKGPRTCTTAKGRKTSIHRGPGGETHAHTETESHNNLSFELKTRAHFAPSLLELFSAAAGN